CHAQQVRARRGQGSEAVDDLFGERVYTRVVGRRRQAFVQRQTHRHVGHVTLGQQGRQTQLHLGGGRQRTVEIGLATFLERLHRALEQVEVHGQAHFGELA